MRLVRTASNGRNLALVVGDRLYLKPDNLCATFTDGRLSSMGSGIYGHSPSDFKLGASAPIPYETD